VVAPEAGRSVLDAYRWVAEALIAGLEVLGMDAAVAEHRSAGRPLDCFAVATGADLEVGGRKICGSAQVRRQGWFLQHGSIPVVDIRSRTARLLGGTVDQTSTCLEESRPGTTWDQTASALIAGFTAAWGAEPSRRPPEAREWGYDGSNLPSRGVRAGQRDLALLQDPLGMV
jgi:lipoate-protein ligase A